MPQIFPPIALPRPLVRDLLSFINEAPSATKRTARHAQRFCLEARRRNGDSYEAHFYPREGSYRARFRIEADRWVKNCECGCADDPCVHTVALAQMLADAAERGTTLANNNASRGEMGVPAAAITPPSARPTRSAAPTTAAKAATSVLSSITRTPKLSPTSRALPPTAKPPPGVTKGIPQELPEASDLSEASIETESPAEAESIEALPPTPDVSASPANSEEIPAPPDLSDEAAEAVPMETQPSPAEEPIPSAAPVRASTFAHAARERTVQRWIEQLEACTPPPMPTSPDWRNLRLRLLGDGGAILESSSGGDFAPPSPQDLDRIELAGDKLPPQARTLLRACIALRQTQGPLVPHLQIGDPVLGHLLRILAVDPLGRAAVADSDGMTLEIHAEPARWELSIPGDAEPLLVCRLPKGLAETHLPLRLPGSPSLAYCGRHVFPGPAQLPDHPGLDACMLPGNALEFPQTVYALRRFGVILPEELLAAHPVKPLSARLTLFASQSSSQPLRLRLEAVDAESNCVYRAEPSGWNRQREDTWAYDLTPVQALGVETHLPSIAQPRAGGEWVPENSPQALAPLLSWIQSLPSAVELVRDQQTQTLFESPLPIQCTIQLKPHPKQKDWGLLRVTLDFPSSLKLSGEERGLLRDATDQFMHLPGKGWFRAEPELRPEVRERLARLGIGEIEPGTGIDIPLHWLQVDAWLRRGLLRHDECGGSVGQSARSELDQAEPPKIPEDCYLALRPYQQAGFEFLVRQSRVELGAILADDRGLGKSTQAIAWFSWLQMQAREKEAPCRILVICPPHAAVQWTTEAGRYAPSLGVYQFLASDEGCLCVLSYEQLRARQSEVTATEWSAIVLDDIEYFVRAESAIAQIIWDLESPHRVVLVSGQAEDVLIQRPGLLQFLHPGLWGSLGEFQRLYPAADQNATERLRLRLEPFVLRHTHKQVRHSLPQRTLIERICLLGSEQHRLYQGELRLARIRLARIQDESELDEARVDIFNHLQRLRRLAASPDSARLESGSAQCSKLDTLCSIIQPLLSAGHSVRLVSPFSEQRDHWGEALRARLQSAHGAVPGAETDSSLDLIIRPFGYLEEHVDYIVALDPWWNPNIEASVIGGPAQRGQIVYRLLVKGTIEERIRSLQRVKAAVTRAELENETSLAALLDLDTLRELLL